MEEVVNKLEKLSESPKKIFKVGELKDLWEVEDNNDLWIGLSKYESQGDLHRVDRGLYSKVVVSELSDYELACGVGGDYAYVSVETVLEEEGIIFHHTPKITVIGQETKSFKSSDGRLVSIRKMEDEYLMKRTGIEEKENYSIATLERAVADIMFYSPTYSFDNSRLIDYNKVQQVKDTIGY